MGIDLAVIAVVAVVIALSGFRVAQQFERALVFRFGRYRGLRGPGLFWIIPLGVSLIRAVNRQWGLNPAVVTGVLWYGLFVLRSIWWVPFRDDRELSWSFWQSIPGNSHLILGMLAFLLLAFTSRNLPKPSTN